MNQITLPSRRWIDCLTLGLSCETEWNYPELVLLCGLSDPSIAELCERPRCFSVKLRSLTQVSNRLGISEGKYPRNAQTPLLYRASVRKYSQ